MLTKSVSGDIYVNLFLFLIDYDSVCHLNKENVTIKTAGMPSPDYKSWFQIYELSHNLWIFSYLFLIEILLCWRL